MSHEQHRISEEPFMDLTQYKCTSWDCCVFIIHVKYSEKFFKTLLIDRRAHIVTCIERRGYSKGKSTLACDLPANSEAVSIGAIRTGDASCDCFQTLDIRISTHGRPKSDTTLTM